MHKVSRLTLGGGYMFTVPDQPWISPRFRCAFCPHHHLCDLLVFGFLFIIGTETGSYFHLFNHWFAACFVGVFYTCLIPL